MAEQLESILKKLLVPDSSVIGEATNELKNALKNSESYELLCQVLTSSSDELVRQYSAVLLRRKLSNYNQWTQISPNIQQGIKQCAMQCLVSEQSKVVQSAIAQLIGMVAKHELRNNSWKELLAFLQQCIQSNELDKQKIGMITMQAVTLSSAELLQAHFNSLLQVFSNFLAAPNHAQLTLLVFKNLINITPFVGCEQINIFKSLIPNCVKVIELFIDNDEDAACEAMELFDELIESEVSIIAGHVKPIVGMCLKIAKSEKLENETRVKGLSVVSALIKYKKRVILKEKLLNPIVDVLFPMICQKIDNDDETSDAFLEADSQEPAVYAAQVMDMLALHVRTDQFIKSLTKFIEPSLKSNNPYKLRAVFVVMAVIAEGCSNFIRHECLETFLEYICTGITSNHVIVQNSALYALGQFSEHIQPEVSKYASKLLPFLLNYLNETCKVLTSGGSDPASLTKTFYAVQSFCEKLESEELLPYLSPLVECLLTFLSDGVSIRAKELAICTLGSAASGAEDKLMPYLAAIMTKMKDYLTLNEEELIPVKIQALDTCGTIASSVGSKNFYPLAHEFMTFGVDILKSNTDPDLRRCTYGLFASISTVLKDEMSKYLPEIIEYMISSLQSTEGVVPHYKENECSFVDIVNEDDDEQDIRIDVDDPQPEEADDDDVTGFSVENAYLDEKEDTCDALQSICRNTGCTFVPYMEKCSQEIIKLIDHPGSDIRKAAIETITEFVICRYNFAEQSNDPQALSALTESVDFVVTKLESVIGKDAERAVVMAALEGLSMLVSSTKTVITSKKRFLDVITGCIKTIMLSKAACQDDDVDDSEDEDDEMGEAELDLLLVECAAEIVVPLAKHCHKDVFAPYFAGLLPHLAARTNKKRTVSERSFAVGTLAEVIEGVQDGIQPFTQHLSPIFLNRLKDSNDEVRSNAVYGLGLLIQHSGPIMYSQYESLLHSMSTMLSKEESLKPMDNICAAVARMISANISLVPIEQVMPALLTNLPLHQDFVEYQAIFKCFFHILTHDQYLGYLADILNVTVDVIAQDKLEADAKQVLCDMLTYLRLNKSELLDKAIGALNAIQSNAGSILASLQQ